jgi:hypothetical protein
VCSLEKLSLRVADGPNGAISGLNPPYTRIMNFKSMIKIDRSICLSVITLAAVATAIQPVRAATLDLKFGTVAASTSDPDYVAALGSLGAGYSRSSLRYTNVAPGVSGVLGNGLDAVFTASPFTVGTGSPYSFQGHIPNFRSTTTSANTTNLPFQDAGVRYQIAGGGLGEGGLNYKIELFETGTNTRYTASDLRFLIYDVDGERVGTNSSGGTSSANQNEAVRIAKGAGLVGYQVGSSAQALIPTEDATSYLFSGRRNDVLETDKSGAAIFYFQNVSEVNFQFEANTLTPALTSPNTVFSAIDGDLSLYGPGALTGFATRVDTSATAFSSTAVPEPFTIIGTIIGGTAAVRMRKKLKAKQAA